MPVFYFENHRHPEWIRFHDLGRERSFGHPRGVAYERDGYFFATGLNNGGDGIAARTNSLAIVDWINQTFGDPAPTELSNEPGVRFNRIFRPSTLGHMRSDSSLDEKLNESFVALRILLRKLEELFDTIQPVPSNAATYGHRIREVLLLACMETEASWTAVLKENGYTTARGVFKTNDYVKLLPAMLLDGYELALQSYRPYPAFAPFGNWNAARPTQSLSWYDAYNKTKHDREGHLGSATLQNAISAVGAAVVMFYAQFGINFGTGSFDQISPIIRNTFRLITVGFDRHERDLYVPLFKVQNNDMVMDSWVTNNYRF